MNGLASMVFWHESNRTYLGHTSRQSAARLSLPQSVTQLEANLLEEWGKIPHSLIDNFIDSMPNRSSTLLYLWETIFSIELDFLSKVLTFVYFTQIISLIPFRF